MGRNKLTNLRERTEMNEAGIMVEVSTKSEPLHLQLFPFCTGTNSVNEIGGGVYNAVVSVSWGHSLPPNMCRHSQPSHVLTEQLVHRYGYLFCENKIKEIKSSLENLESRYNI